MESILMSCEKISIKVVEKLIIQNISLTVNKNQIVGLLGPNGAGKTSTFYAIAGIVKINSGKIIFQENEIHNLPIHKRANHGLAYLPQEPSLFNDLSVIENLNGISELSKQPNLMTVDEIIHTFNLKKIINKKGRELSGGQRRKTEIARTLIGNPRLLLLDEPFSGIDPIAVDEIKDLLSHIKTMGISILITDHNVRETLKICDKSYLMADGLIFLAGTKEEIVSNSLAKEKYLGSSFE
ncbi:MAG: LPS export ABC transporter ATP-binding protein [Gammaproteobacteria bacterium TMED104]|nr:MAG: LPS export ABC transporter ATP-binding protein [Gammaproteobacteria bacterium TMED104]|tara:strand:- start:945 stop:1661 length:717 start_codon:yes stop_codon:yes gene_type:complete